MSAKNSTDVSDAAFVSSCRKVSSTEYEQQKMATQSALADLLDSIVHDENISEKEKRAKLKMVSLHTCVYITVLTVSCLLSSIQFSKQYPEIYAAKFGSASVKH